MNLTEEATWFCVQLYDHHIDVQEKDTNMTAAYCNKYCNFLKKNIFPIPVTCLWKMLQSSLAQGLACEQALGFGRRCEQSELGEDATQYFCDRTSRCISKRSKPASSAREMKCFSLFMGSLRSLTQQLTLLAKERDCKKIVSRLVLPPKPRACSQATQGCTCTGWILPSVDLVQSIFAQSIPGIPWVILESLTKLR